MNFFDMIGALVGDTLASAGVVIAGVRAGVLHEGDTLVFTRAHGPDDLLVVVQGGVLPLPRWAHANTIAALAQRDAGRILMLPRVLAAIALSTSPKTSHRPQEAQL